MRKHKLKKDEVHVWLVHLAEKASKASDFMLTLSEDERERAGRFHFVKDHDRFVLARGFLRTILAEYLGVEPSLVRFSYNPFGKPELAMGPAFESLQFSLSHSHDLAIIAINLGRRIGVDLERIRSGFASDLLARQFMSPREIELLGALPSGQQEKAFFRYWTCKEAYVKARGEGLSLPLSQFEILLNYGGPDAQLIGGEDQLEHSPWSLRGLDVQTGYVAALVVEGRSCYIKYR